MQVDWEGEGTYDHTMFITGVTSNNILLTYHNNNQLDRPITEIISEKPNANFRILHLKDTYNQ